MMFHLEGTLKIVSVSSSEKMAHIWNEREHLLAELCRYAFTWADRDCTALRATSALGIKEQSKADPVSIQSFQWRNQTRWKTPRGQSFLLGSDDTEPVLNNSLWRSSLPRCACHRDQREHRGKYESWALSTQTEPWWHWPRMIDCPLFSFSPCFF